MDSVPQQPVHAIQQLKEYDFTDAQARDDFDKLLRTLRWRALDSSVRNLAQNEKPMDRRHFALLIQMLRRLNGLLEGHLTRGESGSRPQFDRFMQKYGSLFGSSTPASVEELAEGLLQQMAQMESLMKSLSPELGQALEETLDAALRDEELRHELYRLASNLDQMRPGGPPAEAFQFHGDEPLGMEEALERQLERTQRGLHLDVVEAELVRELMGEEAYQELEQLKRMAGVLENGGYIRQVGSRFELTPKGIRKIGHRALQEIFAYIRKGGRGHHRTPFTGAGGDPLEDTKKYQYGDPFNIHLQRSVMNAIQRAPGSPVRMSPQDFEIQQTEQASQTATVLMLDLSLSMAMRGNFPAAKKVALDNLIRTQFPRDSLHIVGFSTYAREVKADKLAYLTWDEHDPYTNIQHGLAMARKLLAKSQGCTKQIIIISDGEPTAHLEGGQLFLQYPPSPRTIQETLKEVKRCTRQDIKINTFMLERSLYLAEFINLMTRINRGRVFYTSPDKLGKYILVDYLANRRRQTA